MMGEFEAAEKKLFDAATKGDFEAFQNLVRGNSNFLERVSFTSSRNLLHAAIKGQNVRIVEEVMEVNEHLVEDLDSRNSSSLHIAAAQGNVEIVEKLLAVAPEMCWWRDSHDMNPVHIAAVKGQEDVLEKLLEWDLLPAMEKVYRGQTVLHLCMKHRQLKTFKFLAKKLEELVRAKDDDGETLLHLAVRCNQIEMIPYLVESGRIDGLITNSMGKTALDILKERPPGPDRPYHHRIKDILLNLPNLEFLRKMSDAPNLVAVLIATMAFQAAVSPPGGVWQDTTTSHNAGEAVMASTHPTIYKHFSRANTTAFVSSLISIILVAVGEIMNQIMGSGGPEALYLLLGITGYPMWVSLASIGVSYGASLIMTNPKKTQPIGHIVAIVFSVLFGIFALAFIYTIRLSRRRWRKRKNWLKEEDRSTVQEA